MTLAYFGKIKYGRILEHKISWKVFKILPKNVLMMALDRP